MKLIREYSYDTKTLVEASKEGQKFYIEGVFMESNRKNRNGRIYKRDILEAAVDKYVTEQVKTGRAVGELNHPDHPDVDYKEASHRIISLEWKGDDVIGKALVLNTPNGKIVQGLLEGGCQLGVSSRGMGSLRQVEGVNYVADDFVLNTVDIVHDPSAPSAFVNGILEGVEWTMSPKGVWTKRDSGSFEHGTERSLSEARRLREMKRLLSNLI